MQIVSDGRWWKVMVGDRSSLPSKYTTYNEAERALSVYKQKVELVQNKRNKLKDKGDKRFKENKKGK